MHSLWQVAWDCWGWGGRGQGAGKAAGTLKSDSSSACICKASMDLTLLGTLNFWGRGKRTGLRGKKMGGAGSAKL